MKKGKLLSNVKQERKLLYNWEENNEGRQAGEEILMQEVRHVINCHNRLVQNVTQCARGWVYALPATNTQTLRD